MAREYARQTATVFTLVILLNLSVMEGASAAEEAIPPKLLSNAYPRCMDGNEKKRGASLYCSCIVNEIQKVFTLKEILKLGEDMKEAKLMGNDPKDLNTLEMQKVLKTAGICQRRATEE